MSRKRGAINARVPGSVVGGRSPTSSTSKPLSFPGLSQRGDFRVFIQLDMPAQRQPFIKFAVMDEQDFAVLDHKDCDSEINFFVNMPHKVTFDLRTFHAYPVD